MVAIVIGCMIMACAGFLICSTMLAWELINWLFKDEKYSGKLRTKPHDIFKG